VGRNGPLPGDFDDLAFFVCRFPVVIGFASLKLNGLVANGTNLEPHLGRDAHNAVQPPTTQVAGEEVRYWENAESRACGQDCKFELQGSMPVDVLSSRWSRRATSVGKGPY